MDEDEMHAQIERQMAEMKRRMEDMMSAEQIDALLAEHPEIIYRLMDVAAGRLIGVFRGYTQGMSNDPNQPRQPRPGERPDPNRPQPDPNQPVDPDDEPVR